MSLRVRILILIGGLIVAFIAILAFAEQSRRTQIAGFAEQLREEQTRDFRRAMGIMERPLRDFVTEAAKLGADPHDSAAWNRLREDFGIGVSWFVDPAGLAVPLSQSADVAALPTLPRPSELVRFASESRTSFFQPSATAPWQFVVQALERRGEPRGWFVAGCEWNARRLGELGALLDARVDLVDRSTAQPPRQGDAELTTHHRLLDVHRRVLSSVAVTRRMNIPPIMQDSRRVLYLSIAFGVLLLIAVTAAMHGWVLRPLRRIRDALAAEDEAAVAPLLEQEDEFSDVARVVTTSFAAKQALRAEIDERERVEAELRSSRESLENEMHLRSRLARDLHDNVIQAIYAAGLGLESVRAQMSEDPFGAEGRMRACTESLNETIRQVRSYINDLEPATDAATQPFASALRALTVTMQELWPISFALTIDRAVADRLGRNVQIHALQIVRECISNAIRHGAATHVTIDLGPQDAGTAVMTVRDNGCGFDPIQKAGTGRGLVNLSLRVREFGGTIRIDSEEGSGATITVQLPISG